MGKSFTISKPSSESKLNSSGARLARGRWWLIAGAVLIVLAGMMQIALIWNWPYTQKAVTKALQDRFARTVQIRSFRKTYFPPGCVLEGVSFEHRKRKDLPPLITIEMLTLRGSYSGLLRIHKRLDRVDVKGLRVTIPPPGSHGGGPPSVMPLTTSTTGATITIGEISTDDAVLEFMPRQRDEEPFRLPIRHLTLDDVREGGVIPYHAALSNTEPPGEIRSDGKIGPWNEDDPGNTPVMGSYTYEHADLGVFEGISGILSSRGGFSGTIGHIEASGQIDVPNFRVSGGRRSVHLISKYQAVVDGTNGDTYLQKLESHFERTTVTSSGSIAGHPGQHGKTAVVELAVTEGRIEDLLNLFTEQKPPSMTGSITLRAKAQLPPGPAGFLRKLELGGSCALASSHFTNPKLQQPINVLTQSAEGENKKQEAEDPATVLSKFTGQVAVKNGVATLSKVSFSASGTRAQIQGTYNLINRKIDLQGILYTGGKLSDTTSGFKALVLKAVGPFLKKKSVTEVPFSITGTSPNVSFSLNFAGKRPEAALRVPKP